VALPNKPLIWPQSPVKFLIFRNHVFGFVSLGFHLGIITADSTPRRPFLTSIAPPPFPLLSRFSNAAAVNLALREPGGVEWKDVNVDRLPRNRTC
jgi:hypothetical protein